MKKLFVVLLIASTIISCQDNEIINPQNGVQGSSNTARAALNPASNAQRIIPGNGVAYSLSSYVPEELYVARDQTMLAVDNTTGSNYLLNPSMPYMYHIASTGGFVYGILGDDLYKIDPSTGVFQAIDTGWTGVEAMTAGRVVNLITKRYVWGVINGTLWKIDLSTNTGTAMGSGWDGTKAMTAGNNHIYIAHGDTLYVVNAISGSVAVLDPSGWNNVKGMTFYNNYIYSIRGGNKLWRTWHNGGTAQLSSASSSYTYAIGLTSYGTSLYMLGNCCGGEIARSIHKVNPDTGALSTVSSGWSGSTAMTGLLQ